MSRIVTFVLALLSAVAGREIAFEASQSEALGVALAAGLGGLAILLGVRWEAWRASHFLRIPDPRKFYGTSTAWVALAGALASILAAFGVGTGAVPSWVAELAPLLALAVTGWRTQVGAGNNADRHDNLQQLAARWRLSRAAKGLA